MRILAIETSCDETSVAIVEFGDGGRRDFSVNPRPRRWRAPRSGIGVNPRHAHRAGLRVLSHIILSQIPVHRKFGGVVPNLAKREHQKNLPVILLQAFKGGRFSISKSKFLISKQYQNSKFKTIKKILEREPELLRQFKKKVIPLEPPPIDAVAVTYGPGLAPALWVGVNFAKALAYLWDKPLIPVNHMAGHVYSALLKQSRIGNHKSQITNHKQIQNTKFKGQNYLEFGVWNLEFPAIALLVSGGHTELVLMRGHGKFKIIGETLDDAAGEAFDKVARILGLPYPGGPEISRLAEKFRIESQEPRINIRLPRPMLNTKDYNFSFSGLKTAVLYLTRDLGARKTKKLRPAIAKEFQDAVVEVLVKKTICAAKEYKVKTILLGGGVAANKSLRDCLSRSVSAEMSKTELLTVPVELAGDNALMIATAAYFSGNKKALDKVGADANLKLNC